MNDDPVYDLESLAALPDSPVALRAARQGRGRWSTSTGSPRIADAIHAERAGAELAGRLQERLVVTIARALRSSRERP